MRILVSQHWEDFKHVTQRAKKRVKGHRPTKDLSVKLYTRLSLTKRYSVAPGCYFICFYRNNQKNSNPNQVVTHVILEIILQLQHLHLRFNSSIRIKKSYLCMFRHVPYWFFHCHFLSKQVRKFLHTHIPGLPFKSIATVQNLFLSPWNWKTLKQIA